MKLNITSPQITLRKNNMANSKTDTPEINTSDVEIKALKKSLHQARDIAEKWRNYYIKGVHMSKIITTVLPWEEKKIDKNVENNR
jgi:DNA-binding protein